MLKNLDIPLLTRQLKRYLVTGIAVTLVDSFVYASLLYFGMDYTPAKALAFISAVIFAYVGHRSWTFSSHSSRKRMLGFASLYMTTFTINVSANSLVLDYLGPRDNWDVTAAFVIATGLAASINFLTMKFLIFRIKDINESEQPA